MATRATTGWVALPSRQGGGVAKRQEAAPCGFQSRFARPILEVGQAELKMHAYGAASCRFATRPVLRTRPGRPKSALPTLITEHADLQVTPLPFEGARIRSKRSAVKQHESDQSGCRLFQEMLAHGR